MQLENGEIECSFLWRPEFSSVNPKLRIAYFDQRLIVAKFDDDNEYPTKGLTAFSGSAQTPWRKVVRAVTDGDIVVCYVDDWVNEPGLVSPIDLSFSSKPSIPMELVGLAWLGEPYSEMAQRLVKANDDALAKIVGAKGPLRDCFSAIVESIRDLDWVDTETDTDPADVLGSALKALINGEDFLSEIRLRAQDISTCRSST
jgi:hypothetical protein